MPELTFPFQPRAYEHRQLHAMIFLAVGVHAVMILGFISHNTSTPPLAHSRPLEITFVTQQSDQAPEEAHFLAPVHQLGGGEQYNDTPLSQPSSTSFVEHSYEQPNPEPNTLTTLPRPSTAMISRRDNESVPLDQEQEHEMLTQAELTTLNKQLQQQYSELANSTAAAPVINHPETATQRRRQISAASHQARDAAYLANWRQYIEQIGNHNYPDEAKRAHLFGELRLLVAIKQDGSLERVELRQSSGHKVLDEAAIRIVQLAAPFEPLPASISKDTDILEIIRTWRFLPKQQGSSH